MYEKLFILILIIKIFEAMKNKNSIIVNWNPVIKRPYPYINEEENNLILKNFINKKLKINSIHII